MTESFVQRMEQVFGPGSCVVLDVRNDGPVAVFGSDEN